MTENKPSIEGIMSVTMENMREMVDVNTVVGEPIVCADGSTVIPISRVSFGFVAGGTTPKAQAQGTPFGGGTGAGVSVSPVGFLCVHKDSVRMLPAQYSDAIDRALEFLPQVLGEVKGFVKSSREAKTKS